MRGKVRKSQFIRTYGPGSIFSAGNTSGVVMDLSRASILVDLDDYRIDDDTLSSTVRNVLQGLTREEWRSENIRVFELPGYGEDGEPVFIPRAAYFPGWHLCTNDHDGRGSVLYYYTRNGCPECGNRTPNPVRFIMVCPYGHLDDVQWSEAVHGSRECRDAHFFWITRGSDIEIRCSRCNRYTTLNRIRQDAEEGRLSCTGRFPETGEREECPSNDRAGESPGRENTMRPLILLRNASSVWIGETLTVLAAWPRITEEHRFFLTYQGVRVNALRIFREKCNSDRNTFAEYLKNSFSEFREKLFEYLDRDTEIRASREFSDLFGDNPEEIHEKLAEVVKDISEAQERGTAEIRSFQEVLEREFESLMRGMKEGIPPRILRGSRVHVEIPARIGTPYGRLFFQSVDRLTVYQILLGYRRVHPVRGRFIHTGWNRGRSVWFPAVVLGGEGVFITFREEGEFRLSGGQNTQRWLELYEQVAGGGHEDLYRDVLFRSGREMPVELHPAFVFLHTLSHLLIRSLGALAGYSSTAIRERVYVFPDRDDPLRARGGILLYSASEDEDGALGGLTSFCRNKGAVKKVMKAVHRQVSECSNDPVCAEHRTGRGKFCGASCHACTTASETSCEHRNMWLDRHVVLENISLISDGQ